jgi:uncharacterized SAM-binding protein YcdF (DUF218 family)
MSYLEPALPLLILIGILGLARTWRRSRKESRPWLMTISVVGILLLSMNAAAWIISLPLEIWYDDSPVPRGTAQAIVILSGTVYPPTGERPYPLAAQNTYERVQHGVWLFQHWKSLPILVCGGTLEGGEAYAAAMKRILESEGIPSEMIWTETHSRSTHENALYGSQVLRAHGATRVALVVEANSMPRAARSFQKQGITVIPAPIRFTNIERNLTDVFPNWRAIALNSEAIHEFGGLVWYRFRGWI